MGALMGWLSVDRNDDDSCPNCGGRGKVLEWVSFTDPKTKVRHRFRDWVQCFECRGKKVKR